MLQSALSTCDGCNGTGHREGPPANWHEDNTSGMLQRDKPRGLIKAVLVHAVVHAATQRGSPSSDKAEQVYFN